MPSFFEKQRLLRFRSKLADLYCKWKYGIAWQSEYIWCPSQMTGTHPKLPNHEIYCRWRHSDPWTVKILDRENYEVIDRFDCNYKDTQVFRVKLFASRIFHEYLKKTVAGDYSNFFLKL